MIERPRKRELRKSAFDHLRSLKKRLKRRRPSQMVITRRFLTGRTAEEKEFIRQIWARAKSFGVIRQTSSRQNAINDFLKQEIGQFQRLEGLSKRIGVGSRSRVFTRYVGSDSAFVLFQAILSVLKKNNRAPTVSELAELTKMPVLNIVKILERLKAKLLTSITDPYSVRPDSDGLTRAQAESRKKINKDWS